MPVGKDGGVWVVQGHYEDKMTGKVVRVYRKKHHVDWMVAARTVKGTVCKVGAHPARWVLPA